MKSAHKLNLKAALIVLISLFYSSVEAQVKSPLPQLGKSRLSQIIVAMTLQEKVRLVAGMGFKLPGMPMPPKGEAPKPINIGVFTFPATAPAVYNIPRKSHGLDGIFSFNL